MSVSHDNSLGMTDELSVFVLAYSKGASGAAHESLLLKGFAYEILIKGPTRYVWWALYTNNYWTVNDTGYYMPNNEWHFLGLTYNMNDGGKFYVDGSSVQTIAADGALISTANDMFIGNNGGFTWYFNGYIAKVYIYNRKLNDSEVSKITKNRTPITDGLVLWLDAGSFDTSAGKWYDLSGNGNHGTNYGATLQTVGQEEVTVY